MRNLHEFTDGSLSFVHDDVGFRSCMGEIVKWVVDC